MLGMKSDTCKSVIIQVAMNQLLVRSTIKTYRNIFMTKVTGVLQGLSTAQVRKVKKGRATIEAYRSVDPK